jgi:ATP-binding cassette subfamily C protein LapB
MAQKINKPAKSARAPVVALANEPPQEADTLQECLRYVLSLQGLTPDLRSVRQSMDNAERALEPAGLQEMAEKLGMNAAIKKIPFAMLSELATPAILLLQGKKSVVYVPERQKGKIYTPGDGNAATDLEQLRNSYMGHAVILSATGREDESTAHMWKQGKIDWFWQPIRAYWPGYAEILICSLFINVFVIALPIFTMNIYDRVVPNFALDTLHVLTIGVHAGLYIRFCLSHHTSAYS